VKKRALITGITGQDGHHLTKFLLSKDYEVHGIIRGQGSTKVLNFSSLFPQATLHTGDLTDMSSLISVLTKSKPTEIYNLGAMSFVGLSFQQPELTANITGLGTLRLLEAVRNTPNISKDIRIYQASSSEMFGKVQSTPQNELTNFYPRSPYGVAKTFAHYSCINYREAYNMFISCGILFNHEGEFRGHEFVTRKITSNVAKISLGQIKRFSLGSLTPKRDWGYAGDFVEAMWKMNQQEIPQTYVIATGETHSVEEFVIEALKYANLDLDIEKYVDFDKNLIRPSEVDLLIGDSSKAKNELDWIPRTDFKSLIKIMVENDIKIEKDKIFK
jgi:GDPmannose 4,6-dehydratase